MDENPLKAVQSSGWLLIVTGAVSMVAGILAIVYPDITLLALALIAGINVFLFGLPARRLLAPCSPGTPPPPRPSPPRSPRPPARAPGSAARPGPPPPRPGGGPRGRRPRAPGRRPSTPTGHLKQAAGC